jgi:hypothetical protein
MNSKELNKLSMLYAIQSVLKKHADIVKSNAALDEAGKYYNDKIAAILAKDNKYLTIKSGAIASKNNAAGELIIIGQKFANALFSLGRKINDDALKAECGLTPSDFNCFRDVELEQKCNHLLECARIHVNELAAYNLDITRLETALATFRTRSEIVPQKKAESKASRQNLSMEFHAANQILRKDLDKLIELVKETAPDFYGEYKAARVISDLHGRRPGNNNAGATTETKTPASPPTPKLAIAA